MSASTKVDTIIDGIRSRILSGEFGEEGRLPSFRKLVDEYQTSQETMNKAMQALQAEGRLISAGAKGVFVNKPRFRFPAMVANFYEELSKLEPDPSEVNIGKPEIIDPSLDLIKKMRLPKGTKVLRRIRKQGTSRTPYRLVEEFFSMSFITDDMLEKINNDPHYHIIEAIKKETGKFSEFAHEELITRLPTAFEQEQLQIVRTNPVIYAQITHFTKDKKTVITCNNKVLNANHFSLIYDYPVSFWK